VKHRRLIGLALLVVGAVALVPDGRLTGPVLLWAVAFGMWLFRGRKASTWSLIAFGVMASVAATATADALFPRWDEGIVFLLGMTATFTATYLLPRSRGGASWALWPALAWAFITVLANDPWGGLARWLLPLVLIGTGVVILGWSRGRR